MLNQKQEITLQTENSKRLARPDYFTSRRGCYRYSRCNGGSSITRKKKVVKYQVVHGLTQGTMLCAQLFGNRGIGSPAATVDPGRPNEAEHAYDMLWELQALCCHQRHAIGVSYGAQLLRGQRWRVGMVDVGGRRPPVARWWTC